MFKRGLDRETIDWYLSPEGLRHLRDVEQSGLYAEYGPDAIRAVVEKLIILREVMDALGLENFQFGAGGGLKAGVLNVLTREQISSRNEQYAETLHARYADEHPHAVEQLKAIFPGFSLQISGRCKHEASISDKLNRKAVDTADKRPVKTLADAESLIGDGFGIKLVLREVRREHVIQVRDDLIRAIRKGRIQVIRLKNYRGNGAEALPYFSARDVDKIRAASEACGHDIDVLDGVDAMKASGYTTTQLRIRLPHAKTASLVNGPVGEFQIRGTHIDRLAKVEHLLYDIRRGKDIYHKQPGVRSVLEPELATLLTTLGSLPEARYRAFTNYLARLYLYNRKLENELEAEIPHLPPGLPKSLDIVEVTRLYNFYEAITSLYEEDKPVATGTLEGQPKLCPQEASVL